MRNRRWSSLRQLVQRWLSSAGTRRALAGLCLGTILVLLSAVAQAAEGGAHHGGGHGVNLWHWDQHQPPVGWFIVDFIVFVGLFVYLLKKPMTALFQKRHDTIKRQIDEAKEVIARAQAHHDEYAQKMASIESEIERMLLNAKKDGELEAQRIVLNARTYSERLRKDALTAIDQEAVFAHRRLYRETMDAALAGAEKLLSAQLTDADRQRLLEQAIDELEKSKPAGGSKKKTAQASGDNP